MNTLAIILLVIWCLVFLYCTKLVNAGNNNFIICEAIFKYHCAMIREGKDELVDYCDMEELNKTVWRFWDWGYKNILPTSKYIIIKPYIEKKKRKPTYLIPFIICLCAVMWAVTVISKPADGIVRIDAAPKIEQQEVVEETEPQPNIAEIYADAIPYIARTVYGEARGCTMDQKAGVIWCILNRVDAGYSNTGNTIKDIIAVVTQPNAFHGHSFNHPVTDELYQLSVDVLTRWEREKAGETAVGRILPKGYLWFRSGGNGTNVYRNAYTNGQIWDWSLESPYK